MRSSAFSSAMKPLVIHRVTTLDLPVRPWSWPFAGERRAEIGERLRADYFETDFASFLAWRDWGFADKGVFNGFGMGALRSIDGAFVMGEMAAHTANAGRIYFPAGTPDLDDLRDNT